MRALRIRSRLLPIACALLAGCFTDVMCPTVPPIPVTAEVVDSVSGQPAALGATGELRYLSATIGMQPVNDRELMAERIATGIFMLTIRKAGYRDYQRGVRIRETECGPEDVRLHVRLVPS